jgi:hypothetical protein
LCSEAIVEAKREHWRPDDAGWVLDMPLPVTTSTKPPHIKRLGVIVVVSDRIRSAALSASLPCQCVLSDCPSHGRVSIEGILSRSAHATTSIASASTP